MTNKWIVDWIDDEHEDVRQASFYSKQAANNWIACKYDDAKYDVDGFEVVNGPYADTSINLWFDAYRPAPKGFKRIASVEDFTDDFVPGISHNFEDINVLSFDTKNDKDGREFIDILNYFDNRNINGFKVHIHGTDANVKQQFIDRANEYKQEVIDNIDYYINESIDNYDDSINQLDESEFKTKLWIDDVRPAPNGYLWIKSVNDFIDYITEHGIQDIIVFDFDHDAGDYQKDGGDYIKCLDYLEFIGVDNINVRLHSANPVGIKNMRAIIQKNGWNEIHTIFESTLTKDEQISLLFENSVSSEETFGEKWDKLDETHAAYNAVQRAIKGDSLQLLDVYAVENNSHFIAYICGGDNCSDDPQKWLRYLENVKKFIAYLLNDCCERVWLIDVNNDCLDDTHYIRIGFKLTDAQNQLTETDMLEQEDIASKDKLIDTLKKASKDFQKNATNNEPEQFAKIVVAFDDLIGGVGKYDFKKKKVLKETDDDINSIEQSTEKICQNIIDAGAPCYSVKLVKSWSGSPTFDIIGRFEDHISLDSLHVHWCSGNEHAEPGWYEGTRCKNKWRKIVCDIITNEFPNGLVEGI